MSDIHKEDRPGRLSIQHAVVDGVLIVTVHGEIDHDVKDVLSQALLSDDGATPPRIVADLSEVTFMDSSGMVTALTRESTAAMRLSRCGSSPRTTSLVGRCRRGRGAGDVPSCKFTFRHEAKGEARSLGGSGLEFAYEPLCGLW
ncbi:STAS domain-containing protein [Streptomyces fodineus]|uniref:STAS domain-containing protein n=1 Tax=Streptomyces fodineus TaxID=1904616 RepID=UPI001D0542AE|nr:STAS domain-containing protein [Streptomyces fodineus]